MPRLQLTRRRYESIVIGSGPDAVTVIIEKVNGNSVQLTIEAPAHVAVDRSEVRAKKEAERCKA